LRLWRKVHKLALCYLLAREMIMPGPAPNTARWSARENKQDDTHVLRVTGQVEVTSTNKAPRLKEAAGGSGPKVFALDLEIGTEDSPGMDVLVWKSAIFQKDVKSDHYDSVVIRWDGKDIARREVVDDDEHSDRLVAVTKVANVKTAAKKRSGAPTAKKKSASTKKRPGAAAKKPRPAAAKKRASAAGKKRPAAKKRVSAAAKRGRSAPAKRGASASARKRRLGRRR
jgi:hypothetical protein